MTDFAFHSVGVILLKNKATEIFVEMVKDLFVQGEISLISLDIYDLDQIVFTSKLFHLDFDDAYQYVAAEKYDLTIVSFDHDFDKTERGRKTPTEVLKEIR